MPPKQVKSRNGCFACKARHIKCDEALPVCTNCIRRKVECSYPASRYTSTTTSGSQGSPSRANSDSDGGMALHAQAQAAASSSSTDLFHLELIHQFTTHTSTTLPQFLFNSGYWKIQAPQLGLTCPTVMHSLLALSSLHIHVLGSGANSHTDYFTLSRRHYQEATEALGRASQHFATERAQPESFILGNHLLFLHTMALPPEANERHVTSSYTSWLTAARPWLTNLAPILQLQIGQLNEPWRSIRRGILSPELTHAQPPALIQLAHPMNEWNSQPGNAEIYAQAVLALRETMALATHPNVDVSAVLYWPARISDTFLQYIMERKPQALVILAYYCAFIQQFQDFWWIRNRGEHDLRIIREVLVDAGEMAWNAWLDEPFRIIQEQNQHPMQISGMVAPFPM